MFEVAQKIGTQTTCTCTKKNFSRRGSGKLTSENEYLGASRSLSYRKKNVESSNCFHTVSLIRIGFAMRFGMLTLTASSRVAVKVCPNLVLYTFHLVTL
jgi:hypothetical protein